MIKIFIFIFQRKKEEKYPRIHMDEKNEEQYSNISINDDKTVLNSINICNNSNNFGNLKKSVFEDIQKIEQKKQNEIKKLRDNVSNVVMRIRGKEFHLLNELNNFYSYQQSELRKVLDFYSLLQKAPEFSSNVLSCKLDEQIEIIKEKLKKIQSDVTKAESIYKPRDYIENLDIGDLHIVNNFSKPCEVKINVNGMISMVRSFTNRIYVIIRTLNEVTFLNLEDEDDKFLFKIPDDESNMRGACSSYLKNLNSKFQVEYYDLCRKPDGALCLLVEYENTKKGRVLQTNSKFTEIKKNDYKIVPSNKPVNKNEIQQMVFSAGKELIIFDNVTKVFKAYIGERVIIDKK